MSKSQGNASENLHLKGYNLLKTYLFLNKCFQAYKNPTRCIIEPFISSTIHLQYGRMECVLFWMRTDENSIIYFNFGGLLVCDLLQPTFNICRLYHSQGLENTLTTVFQQLHKTSQDYAKWARRSQILSEAVILWNRWTPVTHGDQIRDTGPRAHRIYLTFLNPSWKDGQSLIKLLENWFITQNGTCIIGVLSKIHRDNL